MHAYDYRAIELKWQAYWAAHKTFRTPDPGSPDFDPGKPKTYVLDFFPYPSGQGLHIGHPLGYIATDIFARYKRMTGCNVLHPMGFDAFGLPAEQYAIEHNVHPRITVQNNIATMVGQLKLLGLSYDWDREIRTIDPSYYKWTQWIFLQLYGSWFDPRVQQARPIDDLVADLQAGIWRVAADHAVVPAGAVLDSTSAMPDTTSDASSGATLHSTPGAARGTARAWSDLDAADRRAVLDSHRLAYLAEVPVNWCPGLGTVLANEEVTNEGRSERGNFPVFRRPLKQWVLRITAYAERLIGDLDGVDWPEPVKLMQRHWIGKSVGARIDFPIDGVGAVEGGGVVDSEASVDGGAAVIRVFTTRPDTVFGATYMVLAPEHALVDRLTTADRRAAVDAYRTAAAARTEIDRQAETKDKTGVFTGAYALNPATGTRIPIWIADYVLAGYGTGAIMAVPAHDERDFAFARAFGLPIVPVVLPGDDWIAAAAARSGRPGGRDDYLAHAADFPEPFTGDGVSVNAANAEVSLDGLPTPEAKQAIARWLEARGLGRAEVRFKLRDWLFSRQRYWGEPFPILHGPDGEIRPVDAADLPVVLPQMDDFKPEGTGDPDAPPRPPLGRAPADWRQVVVDGTVYERELNTMPNWAGSCWYYLRFIDPANDRALVSPERERYWMGDRGVDLYVGGVEHAVLHLLYARFWHKVLYDLGHVGTPEPFARLFNQGYIQAYAYTDGRGVHVPADEVIERDGQYLYQGEPVRREYGKMGKSLKNMVTPEAIVEQYGCDTLRLYEMYLGPLDASKPWSTRDIVGISRFLARVWRHFVDDATGAARVVDTPADPALVRLLHRTIARVTDDMEGLRFNTAIAALIELNNALSGLDALPRDVADPLVRMLAPLAPHLAEELWQRLGHAESIAHAPWPAFDGAYLVDDTVEIVVQILGKVRGRIVVPSGADAAAVEAAVLADEKVRALVAGLPVRKVIVIPGRLVNIVTG